MADPDRPLSTSAGVPLVPPRPHPVTILPVTILVVDDNRTLNQTLCKLLTAQGYRAIAAYDGLDALDQLSHRQVDIVLSDIVMPRLDGYGLLRKIRATPALHHLPVVFLTGYATPDDRRRAKESGVEDYLAKPLDDHDLLATVRNVLSRRDLVEETIQLQVDAMRSQILSLMQHEFRTPLTFVMGYAEFLQNALGTEVGHAELQHSIEAILEGSRRLHHLIESFLTLASLNESALHPGDLYPLDPMTMWRESVSAMQRELDDTRLRVHFEDPPQPPIVYGVVELMREALIRLLDNAMTYSRADSRAIWLGVAVQPGYVGWAIRDEGIGIAADKVGQIIEPFGRVPQGPSSSHGAGLGLALVQRVAQLHGGFLSVDSQVGVGSTFTLWINDAEPKY